MGNATKPSANVLGKWTRSQQEIDPVASLLTTPPAFPLLWNKNTNSLQGHRGPARRICCSRTPVPLHHAPYPSLPHSRPQPASWLILAGSLLIPASPTLQGDARPGALLSCPVSIGRQLREAALPTRPEAAPPSRLGGDATEGMSVTRRLLATAFLNFGRKEERVVVEGSQEDETITGSTGRTQMLAGPGPRPTRPPRPSASRPVCWAVLCSLCLRGLGL